MGKPEAKVENALRRRIKAIGGEIRKVGWIGRRGAPDERVMLPLFARRRLAVVLNIPAAFNGCNPWVECKAPGQALAPHQEREINRMRALGELVLVIDSLDQIDRYFPLELDT